MRETGSRTAAVVAAAVPFVEDAVDDSSFYACDQYCERTHQNPKLKKSIRRY